ncbi:hypothetical protein [Wenzhouxiangella sp. EGI_FJ10305]|uniref:hypothetical protein n=1 Tax=Wenzhouxiangella sp. EGI_FJ10305 TaxID=3243768 RepID=UPI0035E27E73
MTENWETVFEIQVDGRDVKGERLSEGGYKVSSTQKDDYPGNVSSEPGSHTIIPPSAAGTPFELDAENLAELEKQLVESKEFSPEQAKQIVETFDS